MLFHEQLLEFVSSVQQQNFSSYFQTEKINQLISNKEIACLGGNWHKAIKEFLIEKNITLPVILIKKGTRNNLRLPLYEYDERHEFYICPAQMKALEEYYKMESTAPQEAVEQIKQLANNSINKVAFGILSYAISDNPPRRRFINFYAENAKVIFIDLQYHDTPVFENLDNYEYSTPMFIIQSPTAEILKNSLLKIFLEKLKNEDSFNIFSIIEYRQILGNKFSFHDYSVFMELIKSIIQSSKDNKEQIALEYLKLASNLDHTNSKNLAIWHELIAESKNITCANELSIQLNLYKQRLNIKYIPNSNPQMIDKALYHFNATYLPSAKHSTYREGMLTQFAPSSLSSDSTYLNSHIQTNKKVKTEFVASDLNNPNVYDFSNNNNLVKVKNGKKRKFE